MKRIIKIVFILIVCFSCTQKKETKVLFVILDGIPADVIEKVSTPNLDKIANEGGYTRPMLEGQKMGTRKHQQYLQ